MNSSLPRHCWAVTTTDAPATGELPPAPDPHYEVLCHRRLRGPYTGGGSLLRTVVPELLERNVELVAEHATEVLALAPELAGLVPVPPQTLTNLASPEERTRFYAAARTLRIAHGVAELLMEWARVRHPDGVVIAFRELDHADPTDRELVSVLLRRCPPPVLTLVVETNEVHDDSPLGHALTSFANRVTRPHLAPPPPGADLAQLFIDSDGTSEDITVRRGYDDLAPDERARRHTARATELAALDQTSLRLGAIPYHHEHGIDPTGAGTEALRAALNHCFDLGFYEAAMELALRGRQIVSPSEPSGMYWKLTTRVAGCLSYLGRGMEAIPYLTELRRYTIDPELHMHSNYLMAMLYTRHLAKNVHDENLALEWVNSAIVLADTHPDPKRRVFFGAFMRNARALVELHRGDLQGALALVNEAIRMTDTELETDEHRLHRSVLRHNRAQVLAGLGDRAGALVDFDEVIRRDPDYAEYYFDRAGARRAAGHYAEALADYAMAIRLSPPFPEVYYNRGDLLLELGDEDGALRDLDYVLELDPDQIDALVNRAGIHLGRGDLERARADVDHGLSLAPDNAHLLSARGSLLAETGDDTQAWESYTAALRLDPALVDAWANRAVLSYTMGRAADAVVDLDHALELADDPGLRLNRAIACQELGDHRAALADLDAVLAGTDDPDPDVLHRRELSRYALAAVSADASDAGA